MVSTPARSSTTATQPAMALFRKPFRYSSRLPGWLSVEYRLPIATHPRPRMKWGIPSIARQGSGVQASFLLLAEEQNQSVGCVAIDRERPRPVRAGHQHAGRNGSANRVLNSSCHVDPAITRSECNAVSCRDAASNFRILRERLYAVTLHR